MNKKELILAVAIALIGFLSLTAYAKQQISVTTGFGYYSYNGQIVSDYDMPIGNYSICNGLIQTEVSSENMLNPQQVNGAAYMSFLQNPGCN